MKLLKRCIEGGNKYHLYPDDIHRVIAAHRDMAKAILNKDIPIDQIKEEYYIELQ